MYSMKPHNKYINGFYCGVVENKILNIMKRGDGLSRMYGAMGGGRLVGGARFKKHRHALKTVMIPRQHVWFPSVC